MNPLELYQKSLTGALTGEEKQWLAEQLEKNPYFSLYHFIKAKNALQEKDNHAEEFRKAAALYATDRSKLALYLQQELNIELPVFTAGQISAVPAEIVESASTQTILHEKAEQQPSDTLEASAKVSTQAEITEPVAEVAEVKPASQPVISEAPAQTDFYSAKLQMMLQLRTGMYLPKVKRIQEELTEHLAELKAATAPVAVETETKTETIAPVSPVEATPSLAEQKRQAHQQDEDFLHQILQHTLEESAVPAIETTVKIALEAEQATPAPPPAIPVAEAPQHKEEDVLSIVLKIAEETVSQQEQNAIQVHPELAAKEDEVAIEVNTQAETSTSDTVTSRSLEQEPLTTQSMQRFVEPDFNLSAPVQRMRGVDSPIIPTSADQIEEVAAKTEAQEQSTPAAEQEIPANTTAGMRRFVAPDFNLAAPVQRMRGADSPVFEESTTEQSEVHPSNIISSSSEQTTTEDVTTVDVQSTDTSIPENTTPGMRRFVAPDFNLAAPVQRMRGADSPVFEESTVQKPEIAAERNEPPVQTAPVTESDNATSEIIAEDQLTGQTNTTPGMRRFVAPDFNLSIPVQRMRGADSPIFDGGATTPVESAPAIEVPPATEVATTSTDVSAADITAPDTTTPQNTSPSMRRFVAPDFDLEKPAQRTRGEDSPSLKQLTETAETLAPAAIDTHSPIEAKVEQQGQAKELGGEASFRRFVQPEFDLWPATLHSSYVEGYVPDPEDLPVKSVSTEETAPQSEIDDAFKINAEVITADDAFAYSSAQAPQPEAEKFASETSTKVEQPASVEEDNAPEQKTDVFYNADVYTADEAMSGATSPTQRIVTDSMRRFIEPEFGESKKHMQGGGKFDEKKAVQKEETAAPVSETPPSVTEEAPVVAPVSEIPATPTPPQHSVEAQKTETPPDTFQPKGGTRGYSGKVLDILLGQIATDKPSHPERILPVEQTPVQEDIQPPAEPKRTDAPIAPAADTAPAAPRKYLTGQEMGGSLSSFRRPESTEQQQDSAPSVHPAARVNDQEEIPLAPAVSTSFETVFSADNLEASKLAYTPTSKKFSKDDYFDETYDLMVNSEGNLGRIEKLNVEDELERKITVFRENMDKIRGKNLPNPAEITLRTIQDKFLTNVLSSMGLQTPVSQSAPLHQMTTEQIALLDELNNEMTPDPNRGRNIDSIIEKFKEFEPSIFNQAGRNLPESGISEFQILPTDENASSDDNEIITETLARLHISQGNLVKAREIFEKLKLKFPEKSAYFDAEIFKIS